jgi:hypothetical protein
VSGGPAAGPGRLPDDVAGAMFGAVEARRSATDQMMWQVPALSLTAQSFLLTISLGPDTSGTGRAIAAVLGFLAALATIQLMLKHRFHEEELSRWLERFATEQGWAPVPHAPSERERYAYGGGEHDWRSGNRLRWRLTRMKSPYVWIATLAAFALADVVALVAGVAGWL